MNKAKDAALAAVDNIEAILGHVKMLTRFAEVATQQALSLDAHNEALKIAVRQQETASSRSVVRLAETLQQVFEGLRGGYVAPIFEAEEINKVVQEYAKLLVENKQLHRKVKAYETHSAFAAYRAQEGMASEETDHEYSEDDVPKEIPPGLREAIQDAAMLLEGLQALNPCDGCEHDKTRLQSLRAQRTCAYRCPRQ